MLILKCEWKQLEIRLKFVLHLDGNLAKEGGKVLLIVQMGIMLQTFGQSFHEGIRGVEFGC